MLVLYRKIGYKMKKGIALCLVLIFTIGMTLQVNAASKSLSDATLSISCDVEGVRVSFNVTATDDADEIGCRDILLEEKNGFLWKKINIEEGARKNTSSYGGTAVYRSATKGKTYRASCTYYAIFDGKEQTMKGSTGEMVYN